MMFTLTPLIQVHELPVYIANHSAASFRFTYVETIVIKLNLEKKDRSKRPLNYFLA